MFFFIFGQYMRRGSPSNESELLQGHAACVMCGSAPVRVVDTQSTCHFCYIPLFPLASRLSVVCPICNIEVKLDSHVLQSTLRNRASNKKEQAPMAVATMVGIIRNEPKPSSALEATEGQASPVLGLGESEMQETEHLVRSSDPSIV
jgi:uncharacterized Zn finger protein (UPF0148 family)